MLKLHYLYFSIKSFIYSLIADLFRFFFFWGPDLMPIFHNHIRADQTQTQRQRRSLYKLHVICMMCLFFIFPFSYYLFSRSRYKKTLLHKKSYQVFRIFLFLNFFLKKNLTSLYFYSLFLILPPTLIINCILHSEV